MTISTTLATLRTIVDASSGITTVPSIYPAVINSVDLPLALIMPGPAQWGEQAQGLHRQDRTYSIRVFVKPLAQGMGVDEGVQDCFPVLQALGWTLINNPTLDNNVDHIGISGEFEDTGVVSGGDIMTYGGVSYHGFEISLRVTEKASSS